MRSAMPLVCLAFLACKGGDDDASTVGPTGDSGMPATTTTGAITSPPTTATTSATGDLTGDCVQQADNVLRWDCTFTAATETGLSVSWSPEAGGVSRTANRGSNTTHEVTLWGMRAQSAMTFTATGDNGTVIGGFTTSALPAGVATDAVVSGSSSMDGFLTSLGCADDTGTGIYDGDGQLIWYQTYSGAGGVGGGGLGGFHFTPDKTVLAFVGDTLTEHTLQGEQVLSMTRGSDFVDRPLHHDIFRSENGYTYVLNADTYSVGGTDYVLDGVLVLDAAGEVAEWTSDAEITPSGGGTTGGFWGSEFPDGVDYSHANSVWVGADGVGYISFRHQNAVMSVQLDPDDADFGLRYWTLAGSTTDLSADIQLTGEEFIGQHNFNPFSDGRFGLFDNHIEGGGPGASGNSRGMTIDIDSGGGTATMLEDYDIGLTCSAQGGMYETEDGNRLVTCATEQNVQEFAPGTGTPVFTWDQTCDGGGGPGGGGLLARALPVNL